MSALPRSLSYFLNRMSGYIRNQIMLRAQNQDSARPGDTVVVDLPQGLVDLRTLTMHFDLTTAATAAAQDPQAVLLAPKHAECLIQDILVEAGGILIDSCQNANQLFKILADYTLGQDCSIAREMLALGGDVPEVAKDTEALHANVPVAINNFMGFLSSARPECIDTSLLPQPLKLYFRLAPLSTYAARAATAPSATMANVRFTIDVLDCGPLYSEMLACRLQEGPIEIPFQRWFTFTSGAQGATQDTRFSVSSQSIDLILGTCMAPAYITGGSAINAVTGTSHHFSRVGVASSAFTLNNVRFPMFNTTPATILKT